MSFKNMSVSKKIITGYVIFFIILLAISTFVIFQNSISLGNANTLALNNELNVSIKDALADFLNARVQARIMMLTDDYSDDTFAKANSLLDECISFLNDGLTLTQENNMPQREQMLTSAITGASKYKALLAELNETSRKRAENTASISTLGGKAIDAMTSIIDEQNAIMRAAATSTATVLTGEYDDFYDFLSTKNQMYNVRLLSAKLTYLNNLSVYDSIISSVGELKASLAGFSVKFPARKSGIDAAIAAIDTYSAAVSENNNLLIANNEYSSSLIATYESIYKDLGDASSMAGQELDDMVGKILSGASSSLLVVIILLAVAIVVNILLAMAIVLSINKALNSAMQKLAETTMSVVSASGELLSASGSLAQGGSEQAAAIEETSATMNQTASMVQQNTENTREAAALANDTANVALKGLKEMETLIEFMDKLSKSSNEISKIVDSINTIAFQTNILALNASVEAARAGEAGKSFSVVAEEVRSLSQNSSSAANSTSTIINENIALSNQSVQNSRNVGETLKAISSSITKVTSLVNEISAASEEQSRGVQQINIALSQMEKVTQSNAAVSEESAAAANELMSQANTLERITEELHVLVGN